jgi:hypothetical protein
MFAFEWFQLVPLHVGPNNLRSLQVHGAPFQFTGIGVFNAVGPLYKLNTADSWRERAWFKPFDPDCFQSLLLQCNLLVPLRRGAS